MADEPKREGMISAARGSVATLLALARVRLELLATELQEEKTRIGLIMIYGAGAFLLLGFGIFFLAAFLTVLLWDTNRLLALGVFAAVFLSSGAIFAAVCARYVRTASKMFAASIAELKRDHERVKPNA